MGAVNVGRVPPERNLIRAYKIGQDLTCNQLAIRLGCSLDTAKKLVAGHWWRLSTTLCRRFERRSEGVLPWEAIAEIAEQAVRAAERRRRNGRDPVRSRRRGGERRRRRTSPRAAAGPRATHR